jgi:hypothetical protein
MPKCRGPFLCQGRFPPPARSHSAQRITAGGRCTASRDRSPAQRCPDHGRNQRSPTVPKHVAGLSRRRVSNASIVRCHRVGAVCVRLRERHGWKLRSYRANQYDDADRGGQRDDRWMRGRARFLRGEFAEPFHPCRRPVPATGWTGGWWTPVCDLPIQLHLSRSQHFRLRSTVDPVSRHQSRELRNHRADIRWGIVFSVWRHRRILCPLNTSHRRAGPDRVLPTQWEWWRQSELFSSRCKRVSDPQIHRGGAVGCPRVRDIGWPTSRRAR